MSLTAILKSNSEKGKELKKIINIIKKDIDINQITQEIKQTEIKAPYLLGRDYYLSTLVGTAFDYLARYVLQHYQEKLLQTFKYWIGEFGCMGRSEVAINAFEIMRLAGIEEKRIEKYEDFYFKALEIKEKYVNGDNSPETFDRLVRATVYLAKLEHLFRRGYSSQIESTLLQKPDERVIKELYNQINIFEQAFEENFKFKKMPLKMCLNPSFGECSSAVRGADADLIIQNTLIDFKTTKNLTKFNEDFDQLIAYYLFNEIHNMKIKNNTNNWCISIPNNDVNKICLYMSRFGKFVEYKFTEKDKENIDKAIEEMINFLKLKNNK